MTPILLVFSSSARSDRAISESALLRKSHLVFNVLESP